MKINTQTLFRYPFPKWIWLFHDSDFSDCEIVSFEHLGVATQNKNHFDPK